MEEQKYLLTQEQLNNIVQIAAEKAVTIYYSEEKKMQKRREKEYVRITSRKLQAYRRVKESIKETDEFTDDEKIELRWNFIRDLMGSGLEAIQKVEERISLMEHKRKRDLFEIQSINRAVNLYQKEADKSNNNEFKRRYRELYAMYIDDNAFSIEEISKMEHVSEKTVYRDLAIACEIVADYLLGM